MQTLSQAMSHLLMVLIFTLFLYGGVASAQTYSCLAEKSWVTNPNPPSEVPLGTNADFCQFYQFSWQWFLFLASPSSTDPSQRNFQVAANYPVLEGEANGVQQNSCDESVSSSTMFIRLAKPTGTDVTFVIPERIGQAGGGDTIYDQNGNVVFFNIRFSKNLCDVTTIQSQPNFPPGTTELKSAWRIITDAEKADYFWMEADIDGVPGEELLGLIGFHLVKATQLHPEFIWATFEHKSNVPDCASPQTTPVAGWSFTSNECAQLLADLYQGPFTSTNPPKGATTECVFNDPQPATSLTGTPSEICRNFADSSLPTDLKAAKNITAVNNLNDQLIGPNGFLTMLSSSDPMAVWQNYINVGDIWESDITQPSSVIDNRRGSMRLANTVMETSFQGGFSSGQPFSSSCFGCHNYEVDTSNTLESSSLSHSFSTIIQGQCNVEAGPIWTNADAATKCPTVCEPYQPWNGNWRTTIPGVMSVCGCCDPK